MGTPFRLPTTLSFHAPHGGDSGSSASPPARNLRIAFLVPEDRQTGTYFRYHNLATALQQIGHQVTVYSQSSKNRIRKSIEFRDGLTYHLSATVPGNRWILPPTNPLTFVRRLLNPIAPADVYHLFQPFPSAAIPWMWLRKTRPGLFVYDWDDFWLNDEFGLRAPQGLQARWTALWVRYLESKLPSISHLTTTVSHALAALAEDRKAPRSCVIHNGVWPQEPKTKSLARAVLHLQKEAFYVGLMGWSGEIDWCLEAVRRYARDFPNLRLAICGRDPGRKLEAYSDIANRIDYLGALPSDSFAFFNASLDLGLVPMAKTEFNHYRLPYKLTDHLAGGTPVLCSRIGEASRLADELDGIFACEPDLSSWLTGFRQVVTLLQSSHRPAAFSNAKLLKRFSWPRIACQMGESYGSTPSRDAPRRTSAHR